MGSNAGIANYLQGNVQQCSIYHVSGNSAGNSILDPAETLARINRGRIPLRCIHGSYVGGAGGHEQRISRRTKPCYGNFYLT